MNLTVKSLIKKLSILSQDAFIAVDDYEDGLDTITDIQTINIGLNKNKQNWYGCYEKDEKSEQTAIYLISTRDTK